MDLFNPGHLPDELDGSKTTKNGSIGKVKNVPESYKSQLSNAPQNVENASISGEKDPDYSEGVSNCHWHCSVCRNLLYRHG
jgi:hypothetical protein